MKSLNYGVVCVAVAAFCTCFASAQDLSSLAPALPHIYTVIKKLCGDQPAFSASASLEVTTTGSTNSMMMPSKFTFFGNDMRWDLDAGQMTGEMSPEAAAALREANLDKICFIARLDKKVCYVIFPRVQAYASFPIPGADISEALTTAKNINLKTEVLGKETMDNYACTKNRITVPGEAKFHEEAIVWAATELNNYPIRIDLITPNGSLLFHFRDIKLTPPPPNTFEVDTNYVLKADSQEIMEFAKQQQEQREGLNPLPPSDVGVEGRILHCGITTSGSGVKINAPDDPTGKHLLVTPGTTTLETETNRIPARLGIAFGCYCEVSGLPQQLGDKAEIEAVWTYPPMVKPDGSISKGFSAADLSRINTDGGVRGWVGYRFEKDFELVSGEWKFELRYEGKTLAKQSFTVYRE
ncbi:MAG: DUF3859 domain-containing protein [Verrucomicrobiota bacterium]|jgi:hypothetical protein